MKATFLILVALLLVACTPEILPYTLTHDAQGTEADCSSISYNSPTGAEPYFNLSVRARLVDAASGENISGYARMQHALGGGSLPTDAQYSCYENATSTAMVVHAFADGYAPVAFAVDLPANIFTTLTIPMHPSCSSAQSCTDLLVLSGATAETQEGMRSAVDAVLGLHRSEYTLSCFECDPGRGGYIKGAGTLKTGEAFSFSKDSGWCSSGGADCGATVCVQGPQSLVQPVMRAQCQGMHTGTTQPQENTTGVCGGVYMDTTNATQAACASGSFLTMNGTQARFSVQLRSNRCESVAQPGPQQCL